MKPLKWLAVGMTAVVAVSALVNGAAPVTFRLEDGSKHYFYPPDFKTATPCDLKAHIVKEFRLDAAKFDIIYGSRPVEGNKTFGALGISSGYPLHVKTVDNSRQCR